MTAAETVAKALDNICTCHGFALVTVHPHSPTEQGAQLITFNLDQDKLPAFIQELIKKDKVQEQVHEDAVKELIAGLY